MEKIMEKIIMCDFDELEYVVYKSNNLFDIIGALETIKQLKLQTINDSVEYFHLLYLECIVRQKIFSFEYCPIDEAKSHLTKALNCADDVLNFLYNHNTKQFINPFALLQEKACILCELGRFDNHIKYLNDALGLFKFIRENEHEDYQVINLSLMNEARVRVELALNNVNPLENSIKALDLSEKCRSYFERDHRQQITFLNQYFAIHELNKVESYGFEIESKEILKKFTNKIGGDITIDSLKIDINLIELRIKPFDEFDTIFNNFNTLKENFYHGEHNYYQSLIFEGELYIKKAELSKDKLEKIINLNLCINHFNNIENIPDEYYVTQVKFNTAYAKFQLSKLEKNKEKELLKDSLDLLEQSKYFYENTPMQNNDYFYPCVLLYLAKTKKQLDILDNYISESYQDIEKMLLKSLEYYKKNKNKERIINCYFELGELFFIIGNYEQAYKYLKIGIDLIEIMRDSISNFNVKKKLIESNNKLFELIILSCYFLDKNDEALKYVELSKHRIFLDKIIENQFKDSIKPIKKEIIYELNNIKSKINIYSKKLINCDKYEFKLSHNYKKFSKLKKIQEYYLLRIKHNYPDYYDYYFNYSFDYNQIDLKDKTIIEYYYTKEILLIFLIENNKIIVEKLNLKNYQLLEFIKYFEDKINESKSLREIDSKIIKEIDIILKELFNILIKPIKHEINNKKLIIIPYKKLHNIPFYCLKSNKNYVIDEYLITIAQSGASIKYLENIPINKDYKKSLVIGIQDENLSYTEEEAKFISEILNTNPIINENATRGNILNLIEEKEIIHYAGHGLFDNENPMLSHLKLNDGNLYVKDIEGKNIKSELIVLSACETGIVGVDNLDEADSFISHLQIDGVKYIIASLWAVFDDSTKDLFKEFYTLNGNYPEKLRLSQLKIKEKYDILHWGAFQIYGL